MRVNLELLHEIPGNCRDLAAHYLVTLIPAPVRTGGVSLIVARDREQLAGLERANHGQRPIAVAIHNSHTVLRPFISMNHCNNSLCAFIGGFLECRQDTSQSRNM